MNDGPVSSPPALSQYRGSDLSENARRLYALLAANPLGLRATAVRQLLACPMSDVDAATRELAGFYLICTNDLEMGLLRAVTPNHSRVQFAGPRQRELEARRRELERSLHLYTELEKVYEEATQTSPLRHKTEILTDPAAVARIVAEFSATAQHEVIVSRPGRPTEESVGAVDRETAGRGIPTRIIYQHAVRYTRLAQTIDALVSVGAEVRTRADGFMRLMVVDDRVAMIGLSDQTEGAAIVRDPHTIAFMRTAFERAWSRATPYTAEGDLAIADEVSADVRLTIAHLLVDGLEDKIVARRLGMSLRTYQRHLSAMMQDLGARNRLHLGYLLHGQLTRRPVFAAVPGLTTRQKVTPAMAVPRAS